MVNLRLLRSQLFSYNLSDVSVNVLSYSWLQCSYYGECSFCTVSAFMYGYRSNSCTYRKPASFHMLEVNTQTQTTSPGCSTINVFCPCKMWIHWGNSSKTDLTQTVDPLMLCCFRQSSAALLETLLMLPVSSPIGPSLYPLCCPTGRQSVPCLQVTPQPTEALASSEHST